MGLESGLALAGTQPAPQARLYLLRAAQGAWLLPPGSPSLGASHSQPCRAHFSFPLPRAPLGRVCQVLGGSLCPLDLVFRLCFPGLSPGLSCPWALTPWGWWLQSSPGPALDRNGISSWPGYSCFCCLSSQALPLGMAGRVTRLLGTPALPPSHSPLFPCLFDLLPVLVRSPLPVPRTE